MSGHPRRHCMGYICDKDRVSTGITGANPQEEAGVPPQGVVGPSRFRLAAHTLEGMTALVNFMASTYGRLFRGGVGVLLFVLAVLASGATATILYVLGAFFIGVALFDICVLAPLFGLPLTGKAIRARHS